jgi:signal transduction histidine kinase
LITAGREEVALSVADTGSGIPEADQSRIFEPFEQAGQRKFASSATGVGLALVKSFVTLHGGRIELKSRQGEGTVVTCYLPVSQPSQVAEG